MELGVYLSPDGCELIVLNSYVKWVFDGRASIETENGYYDLMFTVNPFTEWQYLGEL